MGACDDGDRVYLFRSLGVGEVMMVTMFICLGPWVWVMWWGLVMMMTMFICLGAWVLGGGGGL